MTTPKPESKNDDPSRTRLYLGDLAYEISKHEAGDEKITKNHLEIAIKKLQQSTQENSTATENDTAWLRAQLQQTNELLITLRYMILSLSAESDEEVQVSLKYLNDRLNTKQLKKAAETNQNVPSMDAIIQQMEILQGRGGERPNGLAVEKEQEREI